MINIPCKNCITLCMCRNEIRKMIEVEFSNTIVYTTDIMFLEYDVIKLLV